MNKQEPTLDEKLDAIRKQKMFLSVQVIFLVCLIGILFYFSTKLIIANGKAFNIGTLMIMFGTLSLSCFILAYNFLLACKNSNSTIIAEQQLKRLIENKDKEVKNEHS